MKATMTSMKRWLASLFFILSFQVAALLDLSAEIHRSSKARHDFMKQTGHPKGWKGHIIDHVIPLCAGGADTPANLQWQTVDEAKKKDRIEKAQCARLRKAKPKTP